MSDLTLDLIDPTIDYVLVRVADLERGDLREGVVLRCCSSAGVAPGDRVLFAGGEDVLYVVRGGDWAFVRWRAVVARVRGAEAR